jgi:hypothetical protein
VQALLLRPVRTGACCSAVAALGSRPIQQCQVAIARRLLGWVRGSACGSPDRRFRLTSCTLVSALRASVSAPRLEVERLGLRPLDDPLRALDLRVNLCPEQQRDVG